MSYHSMVKGGGELGTMKSGNISLCPAITIIERSNVISCPPVDAVPLDRLMGPAVVVDVSNKTQSNADYTVTAQDFQNWEEKNGRIPDGSIVLGGCVV